MAATSPAVSDSPVPIVRPRARQAATIAAGVAGTSGTVDAEVAAASPAAAGAGARPARRSPGRSRSSARTASPMTMALAVAHQSTGTSTRYIVIATVCASVLALPPRLAGMTPCSITQKRSTVTPTSRARMIPVTHHDRSPSSGQPDQGHARQGLVRDRVGHLAEGGDQVVATGDRPVHEVGDRGEHEHDRGRVACGAELPVVDGQQHGEKRHAQHPQHRQGVGQVDERRVTDRIGGPVRDRGLHSRCSTRSAIRSTPSTSTTTALDQVAHLDTGLTEADRRGRVVGPLMPGPADRRGPARRHRTRGPRPAPRTRSPIRSSARCAMTSSTRAVHLLHALRGRRPRRSCPGSPAASVPSSSL